jgi:hypothetical protein
MTHLVILHRGIFGSPLTDIQNYMKKNLGCMYDIIDTDIDDFYHTTRGIEYCGIRLASHIIKIINLSNSYKQISFIGHSFGGIIIRYAVGILYEKKIFDKIIPSVYISISSPHMGIYQSVQTIGCICVRSITKYMCGQTGKEILFKDNKKILVEISKPDSLYIRAIKLFDKRILYGNIIKDSYTPFETSCIYPYRIISVDCGKIKEIDRYLSDTNISNKYVEEIYKNLNSICWIRKCVDLSTHTIPHIAIIGRNILGKIINYMIIDDCMRYLREQNIISKL